MESGAVGAMEAELLMLELDHCLTVLTPDWCLQLEF